MDQAIETPFLGDSDTDNHERSLAIEELQIQLIGEAILLSLMIGTFVEGLFSMTGLSPFDDDSEGKFYKMLCFVLVFTAASGVCVYCIKRFVTRKIGSDDNVSPTTPSPGPEQQATDLTSPTEQASQLETSPTSPEQQATDLTSPTEQASQLETSPTSPEDQV